MNLELLKTTLFVNAFSIIKLPLLAFVSPKVIELSEKKTTIQVGLGYRTKNHLSVMYFGALAMGAELSIAIKAVREIQKSKKRIDFLFKSFSCEFLKRADGDVHFTSDQADQVAALIERAGQTADRLEGEYSGYAYVVGKEAEPVMKYRLVLSVKNRSFKN